MEEELEYCLNTYGDEDIAAWLSCLSENEQVELLEKSGLAFRNFRLLRGGYLLGMWAGYRCTFC